MNTEQRLRLFHDWLDTIDENLFIMHDWGDPDNCHTPHCMAGWANTFYKLNQRAFQFEGMGFTQWFFGLDDGGADKLHGLGNSYGVSMSGFDSALTPARRKHLMLGFLDHFIRTNEVDWDRIITGLMTAEERNKALFPYAEEDVE